MYQHLISVAFIIDNENKVPRSNSLVNYAERVLFGVSNDT